jgi:L-ascorbate metabolism protein UlaG (beta-lactamase superfamily)
MASNNANSLSQPEKNWMGRFENPWQEWEAPSVGKAIKWKWSQPRLAESPSPEEIEKFDIVKKSPIDFEPYSNYGSQDAIPVTWLGHACVLFKLASINILTDPVWAPSFGPKLVQEITGKRIIDPPCRLEDLPTVDIILISHDHFDHLDRSVVEYFNNNVLWVVPNGIGIHYLSKWGVHNYVELEWWWSSFVYEEKLKLTLLPASHWCGRTLLNRNSNLWGGFMIETLPIEGAIIGIVSKPKRIYFAGDTGYSTQMFDEIIKHYPEGIDLAFLPIGAYSPRWMMRPQHVNPEEAVLIHQKLKIKRSIGIHWGTWILSNEPFFEPIVALQEAKKNLGVPDAAFITLAHGETVIQ